MEHSKNYHEITSEEFKKTHKSVNELSLRLREIRQLFVMSKALHENLYSSLKNRSITKGFKEQDVQDYEVLLARINKAIGE